jgi:hypothetical protein
MKPSEKNTIKAGFMALGCLLAIQAQAALISEGPASQAMGGAHTALGTEPSDVDANPAALILEGSYSVQIQGAWLFDGSQDLGGLQFVAPAGDFPAFGLAGSRLWTPSTGNNSQAYSINLGLPLGLAGDTGLGVNLKYLSEDYGDPGNTLSLDLGAVQRLRFGPAANLNLGFSLQDVDTVLRHRSGLEETLPQDLRLAAALVLGNGFSVAWDNEFVNGSANWEYGLHLGLEQRLWMQHLALRLGYMDLQGFGASDPFGGSGSRVTAGLGLRIEDFDVDYAYLPSSGGVGSSHRGSLTWRFGKGSAAATSAAQPMVLSMTTALSGDGLVYLAWNDPQGLASTSYVILSSFRPDQYFTRLASTGGGQSSLELRGVANASPTYYEVVALDASGQPLPGTASAPVKLEASAAPAGQAALLDGARAALAAGDLNKAKELCSKALEFNPQQADAYLLAQRLQRLAP